jgi:hypothetical protein
MSDVRSEGLLKYRVFKQPLDADGSRPSLEEELAPGTFFVLRQQDVFGPSALYGYAHSIMTLLEGISTFEVEFDDMQVKMLRSLSDAVIELAERWQMTRKKLPD